MPFVKNDPRINRSGRPRLDRTQKYLGMKEWFERLDRAYTGLKPRERVEVCIQMISLIAKHKPTKTTVENETSTSLAEATQFLEQLEMKPSRLPSQNDSSVPTVKSNESEQ